MCKRSPAQYEKAKFVQPVPELISQELFVTGNTCKNINHEDIIVSHLKSQFIKMRVLELEPQCAGANISRNLSDIKYL